MVPKTGVSDAVGKLRNIGTREFLADCPQEILELFRYWDRRRGEGPMPTRAQIDPADFASHLPGILLIDVEGVDDEGHGIFRYRVVGTEEVRIRGWDPTGERVEEGFFGPSLEDVLACYEAVRRERSFLYDPFEFVTPDGRWRNESTIFLPLSEDGESVSQILVYSLKREDRAQK